MPESVSPSAGTGDGRPARDAALDAGHADDVTYLAELGYKQELNRAIGLFSAFSVQFSDIAVWSSIFTAVIVGLAFFGPASFYSWVVGGFCQVFLVGLAVATLVSAYPLAGGAYQIINRILAQSRRRILRQPWLGWQTGWWVVVAHTVSVTATGWAIAPFVANWFGVSLVTSSQIFLWTLGLIAITTAINFLGVRVASRVNNLGTLCELSACVIAIVALLVIHHHTHPLSFLANTGGTTSHGDAPRLFLFALLMPAYFISGFDITGNAAEETSHASRNAALGVTLGNITAWVFGVALIGLAFLAIPNLPEVMSSSLPTKVIMESAVGQNLTQVLQAFAIVAEVATMCILQLTAARIMWSQARDGQMPAAAWLHKITRLHLPGNATIVTVAISVIAAIIARQSASGLAVLAALASLAWALSYGVVVIVGFYGVVTKKLPRRPFHYGKFTPVIFAGAILWSILLWVILIWQNPRQVGGGMLGAIVLGAVLYLLIPASRRGKMAIFTGSTTATDAGLSQEPGAKPLVDL
jgi:amino acid transporter